MTLIAFDSERHGAALRDARIGQEVTFTIRGRVTKLEAEMIDVSDCDALHGRVVTTVLIIEITMPPTAPPVPIDPIDLSNEPRDIEVMA